MIETKYNEIEDNNIKYIFKFITFIITIFFVIFIVYAFKLGIYEDKDILVNYIKELGIGAPIIFIVLQIIQVVIPVIPGGITCLAGVLAFGPVLGFIYNYIALIIGSIIVYYISVKYGIEFIKKLFKEESINKYIKYIDSKCFKTLFLVSIILPFFPDDLLCYIASISKMKFNDYFIINLLGKPISLLGYSIMVGVSFI